MLSATMHANAVRGHACECGPDSLVQMLSTTMHANAVRDGAWFGATHANAVPN